MDVKCLSVCFRFILVLYLSTGYSVSKDLHVKEGSLSKRQLMDFAMARDYPSSKLKRIGRHIEMKTESVLSHLINEVNHRQHNIKDKNKDKSLNRVLRIIKMKLRRLMKKKKIARNITPKTNITTHSLYVKPEKKVL